MTTNNTYTNRDEIAGLPALSLAEFFADDETEINATHVGTWFHLEASDAITAFQKLIDAGLLELVGDGTSAEATKTIKARAVEQSTLKPSLSIADRDSTVLRLLRAIDEVNTSPKTAHRVRATTLIGGCIDGPGRATALVEALVEIGPLARIASVQEALEEFMVTHANAQARAGQLDDDQHAASVQFIKDTLLDANERLSLRFVIK